MDDVMGMWNLVYGCLIILYCSMPVYSPLASTIYDLTSPKIANSFIYFKKTKTKQTTNLQVLFIYYYVSYSLIFGLFSYLLVSAFLE